MDKESAATTIYTEKKRMNGLQSKSKVNTYSITNSLPAPKRQNTLSSAGNTTYRDFQSLMLKLRTALSLEC